MVKHSKGWQNVTIVLYVNWQVILTDSYLLLCFCSFIRFRLSYSYMNDTNFNNDKINYYLQYMIISNLPTLIFDCQSVLQKIPLQSMKYLLKDMMSMNRRICKENHTTRYQWIYILNYYFNITSSTCRANNLSNGEYKDHNHIILILL